MYKCIRIFRHDVYASFVLNNTCHTHKHGHAGDVECEYWRVVEGGDLLLRVEYGNDLDVVSHGSGFPTPQNAKEPTPELNVRLFVWDYSHHACGGPWCFL